MSTMATVQDRLRELTAPFIGLTRRHADADALQRFFQDAFADFPWPLRVSDWTGRRYELGGDAPHWCGRVLEIDVKTPRAAAEILNLNAMGTLERYLEGELDLRGNLYILSEIRRHAKLPLKVWQVLPGLLKNSAFQSTSRARVAVKSHYDIPQDALNAYLDQAYMSYSCGMWDEPHALERDDMTRIGQGPFAQDDGQPDSLEKSQWRKFKDAADFIAPKPGETLLDVGCGYGGQIAVALENHPFGRVVGWTHSSNQASEGKRRILAHLDPDQWELNEGDYRQDERVYDHITSTGMISHVGPRGLEPYVRNVRRRIKTGGRYLHHALMTHASPLPIDLNVGIAFNKKYVWPGFHWFTVGQHVRALEKNGFQIEAVRNLTFHYAKTTASWYERFMAQRELMAKNLGEPTARAWEVFLAGITGSYLGRRTHVYRLYCTATDV